MPAPSAPFEHLSCQGLFLRYRENGSFCCLNAFRDEMEHPSCIQVGLEQGKKNVLCINVKLVPSLRLLHQKARSGR